MSEDRETDFKPDWSKYPKLAGVFEHRPTVNVYWDELRSMLREARADAVRFINDAKAEELRKAREQALASMSIEPMALEARCSICGSEYAMMSVGAEPRCPTHADVRVSRLSRQVAAFHKAFGQPILDKPQVPDDARVRLRLKLIADEFFELLDACNLPYTDSMRETFDANISFPTKVDLPQMADALADLDYVVEGTRLEFGINGAPIADEVHRANMTKVGGHKREDGKWMKPPGFTPPDIAGELRKQGWQG